jgi:hypothetical protein
VLFVKGVVRILELITTTLLATELNYLLEQSLVLIFKFGDLALIS